MIVRDEQDNLPTCLESVRGVFDEIVVVDTGSTDRTAEIARSFGARVFDFVWVDDFAAARNEALKRATGDYAFWLDADDVVEPAQRQKLEEILKRLRKGQEVAYVVRCACDPSPDGTGGDTVVDHIRLFPLREAAERCSAGPVVGQWADGARKPKLLPDRQFAFPGGVWARRVHQKPTVNDAGPTAPRHVIVTRL